ncbi:MAG: hypothetical protein QNJ72_42900, partial [Pleurocapsa sp. MO_226.B13]|nr:hypothetical protein [Pleurocapsa sp. MO_226.B13]
MPKRGNSFSEITLVLSQITTTLEPQAIGDGGNITISASSLVVNNDAFISATTLGQGNAGGIDITANSLVMSDRAQVSISTGGVGNAGEINLTTTNLNLTNGSSIVTQTDNPIEASNVRIEASESIELLHKYFVVCLKVIFIAIFGNKNSKNPTLFFIQYYTAIA